MEKQNFKMIEKKITRRDFLKAGGAVVASAVLLNSLSSCTSRGSETSNPTSPTTGSTSVASTNVTSAQSPKMGGTLRVILSSSSGANIGWPPEIATSAIASGMNQEMCETLLRGDNKGGVYPWLAESFKTADDLSSITFNLRKDVKFHDGSDFNAEVAKWNLENYIETKVSPYTLWDSVDIIDDFTIRVNFNSWQCNLVSSFAEGNPAAPIVSKAAFDKNGVEWMRAHPTGTGPFKFESYVQDVSIVEAKNPNYWGQGKPYLDRMEYLFVADMNTQEMEMNVGDAEMAQLQGPKTAHDYSGMGLNVDIYMEDNHFLAPDTANPDSPFANQKVREALEYAIDRQGIVNAFGYGYWKVPYQVPSRASAAYDPNFTGGRTYDPEKAKQLLDDAGYTGNPRIKTTIIVGPFALSVNRNPIISVQTSLANVGIQADLEFPQFGKWATYMGAGTWPKGTLICSPIPMFDTSYLGGINFLNSMFGTSWQRTAEFKKAVQAALTAPTKDINLIRAVTDITTKDASLIPICESGSGFAKKPYVNANFNERGFMAFWNSENFWLNK